MVRPLGLLLNVLLKLIPGGNQAPICREPGRFAQAHNDWYRATQRNG
jgi:hypothetical protein